LAGRIDLPQRIQPISVPFVDLDQRSAKTPCHAFFSIEGRAGKMRCDIPFPNLVMGNTLKQAPRLRIEQTYFPVAVLSGKGKL
jgi:hypothetical protein